MGGVVVGVRPVSGVDDRMVALALELVRGPVGLLAARVLGVPDLGRRRGEGAFGGRGREDDLDELPVALVGVHVVVEVPEEPVLENDAAGRRGVRREMGVGHVGLAGAEAVEVLLEAAAGPARVAGEVERGLRPPARQLPGVGALRDDVAVAVEQDDLGLVEHGLDRHRAVCLARAVARPGLVPDNDDRRVARRELGRGGVVRRRRGRGRGAGADGGGQRDERRRQAGPHRPSSATGRAQSAGGSPPPSSATRAPKRISGGCGAIRPATSDSPSRNPVARSRIPRRHQREQRGQTGDVGGRVHPHQDQVVALGQDALVPNQVRFDRIEKTKSDTDSNPDFF